MCGVYRDMFEQSILAAESPQRRIQSVAASLTMQTLAVGTVLLIPLIYTSTIGTAQLLTATFLPMQPPPPPPPIETEIRRRPLSRRATNPFQVPTSIPPLTRVIEHIEEFTEIDPVVTGGSLPPGVPVIAVLPIAIAPPPPPLVTPSATASNKPLQMTSTLLSSKLVKKVVPIYPRLAMTARVSGVVKLMATVGRDGTVQHLDVVSGPALLIQAAVDAVRQWLYTPTVLNGQPVEVMAPIDVTFVLNQ